MTQFAVHREFYVASGLVLSGKEAPKGKPTGDGFTPENEKSPPANGVSKETKPGCAANTGTVNDSGCPLARLPLVTFEFMVCKGTADGGGNTWALECTF